MKQFAHTTGARYNSRLADQFPKGTDLHERAMQMVQSDLDDFVAVHPDTHARCRREYFEADEYKMHVFGTCGSRDPQSKYEVKELTTLAPTHWVRVPEGSLQLLKSEPLIKLLRVPTKTADASATIHEDEDEEEQHVEVEVRRHEFHNFWEREGDTRGRGRGGTRRGRGSTARVPQLLGARRQGVPYRAGGRFRRRKNRASFDLRVRLLRQALG